jgi:hypothetical protein
MDSKVVNRYIRELIRPELKATGFSKFTTRNSWRYRGNVVDVINFQSFNSYNADVMGVTTYSFGINLGSFHLDIPTEHGNIKSKSDLPCPEEFQCPFRGGLQRTFEQCELERRDIWFIKPDGSNIEECILDAKDQILNRGLDWFKNLDTKEAIRDILISKPESMDELLGFGRNPSPRRSYLLGYVELKLRNESVARAHFENAINSGCFSSLFNTVDEAIERAL